MDYASMARTTLRYLHKSELPPISHPPFFQHGRLGRQRAAFQCLLGIVLKYILHFLTMRSRMIHILQLTTYAEVLSLPSDW